MIIELLTYFARFVSVKGVETLFTSHNSEIEGYSELKSRLAALSPEPVVDYLVFGVDFSAVKKRVDAIPGNEYFLFVDYGEITCQRDRAGRYADRARIAITVATKKKSFNSDLAEMALVSESCLARLSKIRSIMLCDRKANRLWLSSMQDDHQMIPFSAPELGSVGWSMLFERQYFDNFNVRGALPRK